MKRLILAYLLSAIFVPLTGCKVASEDQCKNDDMSTRSDCTELLDRMAPVISGVIEIAAVTSSSIVFSWEAASDNVTSVDQLEYQVLVSSRTEALNTIEDVLKLPRSSILVNTVQQQRSYELTGLAAGTSYAIAVVVRDEEGNPSLYQPVIQTTWDPSATRPGSFTMIEAKSGDGQVELSWNAAEGATGYIIKRGTVSGVYTTVARASSSPLTDNGLTNGLTYYYRVTAENLGGWTESTSELSVIPMGQDLTAPTLVGLTPLSATGSSLPTQIIATFSEAMKALTAESFSIQATGCTVLPQISALAESNNASTWTATLTPGTCGDGAEVVITVDPTKLSDLAGNAGTGSVSSNTYTIDYVAPSITYATPSKLFVRNGISVTIDANFFDAITTSLSVGSSDIALQASGSAACSANLSNISASGARVTLSSCTGDGTIKARLAAGVLTGNGGLQNTAADSGTVTVDNTTPVFSGLAFPAYTVVPTAVTATFNEAMSDIPVGVFDVSGSSCTNSSPTVISVTSSADRKIWTANLGVSGCIALDNIVVTVDPASLSDLAGNMSTDCPDTVGLCFVGQTLVMTPEGSRPLRDLKPGEQVISYNFTSNKDEVAVIQEVTQHDVHDVSTIINDKGESLIGASGHRLLSKDGQRMQLKHAAKWGFRTVDTLHVKAPVLMFDLILDRNHNFYANGSLVESIRPLPTRARAKGSDPSANFCFVRN
jgi:hypothetical protein